MTARLREALREATRDVPAYPVYERALGTARRSRRRAAATAVAVLAVCALALGSLPAVTRPPVAAAGRGPGALPDRIAVPVIGALHATDRPRLGPAALVYSGQATGLSGWDEDGIVGVVGADSDRYRTFEVGYEAPVGEQVLLSPDGRLVAYPAGGDLRPRVDLLDLVAGRTRQLASAVPGSVATKPVAWSRDGARLVVRDTVSTDPRRTGYRAVLSLVTLDGERWVQLTDGPHDADFASTVAFDRRGWLAHQTDRTVTVVEPGGLPVSSFELPPEAALAGKGAWLPDGTLALVVRRDGTTTWSLRRVDPASGRDLGAPALPAVDGVTTIRLLGWRPDGSAVVVAFQPEPHSPARFDETLAMDQRTAYGNVRTVRVLALSPGAAAPATLLTAPDQVLAVDVADDVVAGGRTRKADPPRGVGGRFWFWTALGGAVLLAVLVRRRREELAIRAARRW